MELREAKKHWEKYRVQFHARDDAGFKDLIYIWGYEAALENAARLNPLESVPFEYRELWYMGNDDARGDFGLPPRTG